MNKILCIIVLLAMIFISWAVVLNSGSNNDDKIGEIINQISYNNEVKTYKNNLALYNELIKLQPDNINWYTGLADTYANLGQMGNYKTQCENTVRKFPDNKIGFIKLIRYYSESSDHKSVIDLFNSAGQEIKEDKEFLEYYKKSEWEWKYYGSAYHSISPLLNDIYIVEISGLYGFVNSNFTVAVPTKFIYARPFIESYSAVFADDEWYFADKEGDRVLASVTKYEDLYSFNNSLAVAKLNGKYGYIDYNFNQYSFEFEEACTFNNGVAAVKKDGKWGIINSSFMPVTAFEYDDIITDESKISCRSGIIFLKKDGKYYMFNNEGQKTYENGFEDAKLFYSNYAAVKKDGKWGFVDTAGNTIIDFTYDNADSCNSKYGLFSVCKGDKWGVINSSGEILIPFDFEDIKITSTDGTISVKSDGVYRFLKFLKYS